MPLNQALKGKEYQKVEFTVEREHVLRFDDAIGEDNPLFRDAGAARAAGFDEQLAPPTFVTTMQIMTSGQAVVDPELGLDYSRVVHGQQEYEYRRPVRVGETLWAIPRVADIYTKMSNEYLVIESEIKDAEGEVVVVARTMLLSRGTARA